MARRDLAPRRTRRTVIQRAAVLSAPIVSAAMCMLVVATPALAQPARAIGAAAVSASMPSPKPAAASRIDVSPQAAGIDRIVAADLREVPAHGRVPAPEVQIPPPARPGPRSFWKTPWPYVIIGIGTVVVFWWH